MDIPQQLFQTFRSSHPAGEEPRRDGARFKQRAAIHLLTGRHLWYEQYRIGCFTPVTQEQQESIER